MEFIPSDESYAADAAAQHLWGKLSMLLGDVDGIAYYKHPVMTSVNSTPPDIALLARGYQPYVFLICNATIDEIESLSSFEWRISGASVDSPLMELDDLSTIVSGRMDRVRVLRKKFSARGVLCFPQISRNAIYAKFIEAEAIFGEMENSISVVWSDFDLSIMTASQVLLSDTEWRAAQSVFQGVNPLNRQPTEIASSASTMGDAVRLLEKEIALLDHEQHRVATQMAPGPQRIRGLAGTGKTIVLAMKAANIHRRYPEKKVLFTFNTQSLYNQVKKLITKFYREFAEEDPNWENLHIRHGWGGRERPGVYTDVCRTQGQMPWALPQAQAVNKRNPFSAACGHALKLQILPSYDFILVDEAQDFPRDFFRILAKLIDQEKRTIYFAYDELQSLSAFEIPSPSDLFGNDADGKPFIDLDGEYPGPIEKDFVLHKSYRCPIDILLLAHGVGLGIHAPNGCVQMLRSRESWGAVGYEVESGDFTVGSNTVIHRPVENSPNRIRQIYSGDEEDISLHSFTTRDEELEAIAVGIKRAIEFEGLLPEQILVICLDSIQAKKYFLNLQRRLHEKGVQSSVPGLFNQSWEFGEEGRVTLSTIYRAKGNEAPLVFICATDYLHGYLDEIERRNRTFAAISRSKAWLRLTGVGDVMDRVISELNSIRADIPRLRFKFPNMDDIRIRKLDATETTKRRRVVTGSKNAMRNLLSADIDALRENPELLDLLFKKLSGAQGGD